MMQCREKEKGHSLERGNVVFKSIGTQLGTRPRAAFDPQRTRHLLHHIHELLLIILVLCVLDLPFDCQAAESDIEEDLQDSLIQSKVTVEGIQTKLALNASAANEISQLKAAAENIVITKLLLEERFKLRQDKARSLGSYALSRHHVMVEGFRAALMEYLSLIDSLPADGTIQQTTIDKLTALLNRILPKKKLPIIGSLPYKHLNYPSRQLTTASSITPAYLGGNKTVTPDDTATTGEAPISNEIAALAQSLNWNPVSLYEYVKNNIKTEWYWGCMKGAEETLHQKGGNDCDQATLLTALLRASGFPTRYVRGVIQFFPDIERAKNLTGIEDPVKIAEFYQKAGIPYAPLIIGGKIANIQVEHIWVESQIPYANYRGAVIDDNGKVWLGLDTSIKVKGYAYNNPPEISSTMSLSMVRDEYLGLSTGSTGSTPYELHQTPVEYLQSSINSELRAGNTQLTYPDFLRTKNQISEVLNILPASMQFTLIKATNEYITIPDELIHKIQFTATSGTQSVANSTEDELFSVTLPAYRLSNQQVALGYEPETIQDQEIIDSYGGLNNTPGYLVRLRPVLRINNERIIVARDGLPMGTEYNLILELQTPNSNLTSETISSTQIAGNITTIGIVAGKAVPGAAFNAQSTKNADALFYGEAINYIDQWNKTEEELASLLHLSLVRPLPTVVTIGGVIDVMTLMNMPQGLTWKGIFMDAAFRSAEVVGSGQVTGSSIPDPVDREKTFMRLSALQGSVLEHKVIEDDLKIESISTAKLIQVYNQGSEGIGQGSGLLTIDKSNIDAVLPSLVMDDNIKADISNSVNQNLRVIIPQMKLVYQDWNGIGYIKENPATGESGFMLSGMIAGGMTAWDVDKWPAALKAILHNTFSEPPNFDPASARYIQKLPEGDMQSGPVNSKLPKNLSIKVTDMDQKAVANVLVTFTIKAGGGTFDAMSTTVTTTSVTNDQGVASVPFIPGKHTKDNPAYRNPGNAYSTQVGENIVDAALPSGTNITRPFTVYGLPGPAHHITPIYPPKGTYIPGDALSFAGFASAAVEDADNNPISNVTVTFEVSDSVKQTNTVTSCPWQLDTIQNTYLVSKGANCLDNAPKWGTCGVVSQQLLAATTDHTGAAAQVILGGTQNATFTITASALDSSGTTISTNFEFRSNDIYQKNNIICDGSASPIRQLVLMHTYASDAYGNSLNAGKTGSIIPVRANLYYLVDAIGNGHFTTDTNFHGSLTFSGPTTDVQGTDQGNGVFIADYPLAKGVNNIVITGTANDSFGSKTATQTMTAYGVDIATQALPLLLVNDQGYLNRDLIITYAITPAEYKASTASVMIYKDGNVVAQIPAEKQGTGAAILSRGFQFDVNSTYEAEVVLNFGTGGEIKGDKKEIPLAQIRVMTDESPAKEADEIKFSDGSNKSTNAKKYHVEITSKLINSSCATLTGRIVTLSTATATAGQPVATPRNNGGAYASEYPLAFHHPILPLGNNLCIAQIADAIDSGSLKDKFILSNRSRNDLEPSNISNTSVLYGGIGNKFWIEVAGVGKELPIEPVGVVILGVDGLRQDVLYAPQGSGGSDVKASYPETNGCGDQSCYVDLSTIKGFCAVLGGKYDDGILGLGSSCDPTGAESKHIKLQNVTTIFPSITFAAWASIFTGMTPSATGITGNEFFARDLYSASIPINAMVAGMNTLPSGMVTLDADGGAMRAKPTSDLVSSLLGWGNESAPFALNCVMPAEFLGYNTLSEKLATSAPGDVLKAVPLWKDVNDIVTGRYQINTTDRCDQSANECRTVSMFNQYAGGVDWWGTPSVKWKTLWGQMWDGSLFDSASTSETVDFISNYFKQTTISGKRKRFPALFSVYLPGLDHDAHMNGMGHYKTFVHETVDEKVSQIVRRLKARMSSIIRYSSSSRIMVIRRCRRSRLYRNEPPDGSREW